MLGLSFSIGDTTHSTPNLYVQQVKPFEIAVAEVMPVKTCAQGSCGRDMLTSVPVLRVCSKTKIIDVCQKPMLLFIWQHAVCSKRNWKRLLEKVPRQILGKSSKVWKHPLFPCLPFFGSVPLPRSHV